jgi:GNAT superfamily N-acetyltransferase
MSAGIRLRPAVPADVPLILRMIRALADYERLGDQVIGTEDLLAETLFGSRPAAEVVLAYDHEEPAGFAVFFQTFSTFLARPGIYLEDLFVVPDRRGRGIGRRLFTHVARVAVERRCGRMEWSVLDWNSPAIGFYRKMGAQPMEEWTVFRLTGRALENAGR